MFVILLTLTLAKEYQLIVYEGNFYSTSELKFESKSSNSIGKNKVRKFCRTVFHSASG